MFPKKKTTAIAAVVALTILDGGMAFACTEEVPGQRVIQSGAGVCAPVSALFDSTGVPSLGTVVAQGEGAVINIGHDTMAYSTRGGGTGAGYHATGGTAVTPALISSPADVTLSVISGTRTNSHGFRAGNHGQLDILGDVIGISRENQARIILATSNGRIFIGGDADLTIDPSSGENSRAISLEGNVATTFVEIAGNVTVLSRNASGRGVRFSDGNLTIGGHFDIDVSTGNNGIYVTGSSGFIDLNTFTIQAGSGSAIDATGGVVLTSSGVGEIISPSSAASSIGVNLAHGAANVSLGANSSITMEGGSKTAVRIAGSAAFGAEPGLVIDASQTGFNYAGSTTPVVLSNAMVTAPVVWNADASTNTSFTGTDGGIYNGASTTAAGGVLNLNLENAALWEATADSSFTALSLRSDGTLDASLLPALNASGNIVNEGGVVTLAKSDSAPTNALALSGTYTANGGSLELNTVLNDASTSTSDVLVVDEVLAGGVPTAITVVPDAASAGALTTGNGILVVEVRGGPAVSAAGAFVLAGDLDHNGIRYDLVRNASDGNWYLQATRSTPPADGNVTPVPGLGLAGLLMLSALFGLCFTRQRRVA